MKLRKALALLLALVLVIGLTPTMPFAAGGPIGSILVLGDNNLYPTGDPDEYYSYTELRNDLASYQNEQIIVEMYTDWISDCNLIIPKGSVVSLFMKYHTIDRGLRNLTDSGELIWVQEGATLTVNGSIGTPGHYYETSKEKKPYLYNADGTAKQTEIANSDFKGMLTGGANNNGAGGIHVSWGANLNLIDVVIAGCQSSRNGGGIYYEARDNNHVELNNSEIIGCYAVGNGGGLYGTGQDGEILLYRGSAFNQNSAGSNGGGMYIDGDGTHIAGSGNSRLSGNKSKSGGGFALYAHGIDVNGLTLTDNNARWGGGIFSYWGGSSLNDLVIKKNEAIEYGGGIAYDYNYTADIIRDFIATEGDRGSVITTEKDVTGNAATVRHQILYSGNRITNCEITGNTAYYAGGVFMKDGNGVAGFDVTKLIAQVGYQDLSLRGKVIINENKCTATGNDQYLQNLAVMNGNNETYAHSWEYGRIMTDLSAGSAVGISYQDNDRSETIILTPPQMKDNDSTKYLSSDQPGWHFQYENGQTKRVLGFKPMPVDKTPVASSDANDASVKNGNNGTAAGKVGTVGAGGETGTDYDLIRFFSNHENGFDFISAVYYSDGLFYGDPYTYNEHLATASWALAYAAGYISVDPEEVNGNIFYNKHATARQFMADIGCPDQNIYVSDSMVKEPGADTIGVTIGSKELVKANGEKTGDILIPITVRGLAYGQEWLSNLTLGTVDETANINYEAMGFSHAADQVTTEIETYLKMYGFEDAYKEGHVKFWITGFSRAGATANITAKRLVEKIETDCTGTKSQVFAYPCEAAKGGTDNAQKLEPTRYYCIHNMVNKADIVPYVGPAEMGFKRYGVDHYIPGTNAGTVQESVKNVIRGGEGGVTQVTTYVDNTAVLTKTTEYETQKALMLKQLQAVDSGFTFDDYFRPMALHFLEIGFFSYETMRMFETGNDSNRIEDFVADFIRFAQEGGRVPNTVGDWSQPIYSRDKYSKDPVTIKDKTYPPVQNALKALMGMFMAMPESESKNFTDKASNIVDKIDTFALSSISKTFLYLDVVGEWFECDENLKNTYSVRLWDSLSKTGALDELTEDNKRVLEENWGTVLDLAFRFLDADYNKYSVSSPSGSITPYMSWAQGTNETMLYLPTMMTYMSQIIKYHLPQLNIAWARSYDDWYKDEKTEYTLTTFSSVNPPEAFVEVAKENSGSESGLQQKTLKTTDSISANDLIGDQKVILENKEIVGEAIYYDLIDHSSNKVLATNQIYRGGIDLTLGSALRKDYEITTYDMSYGTKSSPVTYRVILRDGNHTVIVEDKDANGEVRTQEFTYSEGQEAVIQAGVPNGMYFKQWNVRLLTQNDNIYNGDVSLLDGQAGNDTVKFNMPEAVGDMYTSGYKLKFTAEYGNRITAAEVTTVEPVAGQDLASEFEIALTGGSEPKTVSFPVEWTYYVSGNPPRNIHTSGNAYNKTVYTATITLPADKANGIIFDSSVRVSLASGSAGTITNAVYPAGYRSVQRNNADGSISFEISFRATGAEGGANSPTSTQTITVNAIDLNTKSQDTDTPKFEYYVHPDQTITITAPDVPGLKFVSWNLGVSGLTPVESSLDDALNNKTITITVPSNMANAVSIDAQYIPVVEKVEVKLLNEDSSPFTPAGGKSGTTATPQMFVKISNEYEINPSNLKLEWSPALKNGSFELLTGYTAKVSIVPDEDGTVKVRPKDSDASFNMPIQLKFVQADTMQITFNGGSDQVSFDAANLSVSKAFPPEKYTLTSVTSPGNIENEQHGKNESDIADMLPAMTKILTESGQTFDAEITWNSVTQTEGTGDARNAAVWTASGTVTPPESVMNPNEVSTAVTMTISVQGAGTAMAPTATLSSGTYSYNQVTSLVTNESGGTTYYTTDGSEPTTSSTVYDGKQIFISRESARDELDENNKPTGRKLFVLKAYTVATDMWDSSVSTYEYVFTPDYTITVDDGITNGKVIAKAGDTDSANTAHYNDIVTLTVTPENGYELDSLTYTPEGGEAVAITEDEGVYSFRMPDSNVTVTATFKAAEEMPKFTVQSLVLSGEIGVNFFMDLSSLTDEEKEASYMTFNISGKGTTTGRDDFDADDRNNSGDYYCFTCYVNSIQMADTITAIYHYMKDGEEKTVEKTYSVEEYIETFDAYKDSFDEKTAALVKSLADLGYYVQPFLSDTRGWEIGTDYTEMEKHYTDSYNIDQVKASVNKYKIIRKNKNPDINEITYYLTLDSETAVNLNIKPVDGYTGFFKVTVDGKRAETVKIDGQYIVKIPNIAAHQLGRTHTIVVATDRGKATVKVSALSYVQGLLASSSDANARNAAAALYSYFKAADDYLNQ